MSVLTSLIHCLNLALKVPTCYLPQQFMFTLTTYKMSYDPSCKEPSGTVAHNCKFRGPEVTQKPTPSV